MRGLPVGYFTSLYRAKLCLLDRVDIVGSWISVRSEIQLQLDYGRMTSGCGRVDIGVWLLCLLCCSLLEYSEYLISCRFGFYWVRSTPTVDRWYICPSERWLFNFEASHWFAQRKRMNVEEWVDGWMDGCNDGKPKSNLYRVCVLWTMTWFALCSRCELEIVRFREIPVEKGRISQSLESSSWRREESVEPTW